MSKCPDCGRENVSEPAGTAALCGRRIQHNDASDDWRVRILQGNACKRAAERRKARTEKQATE